ncbi:MAG: hypothetical protein PHO15_08270 [Eubacteriales bacterium]|nr:hypothetical protein [Eubacteriales bacterium]
MIVEVDGQITLSPYENVMVIPFKSREKAAKAIEGTAEAKHPVICDIKQKRPKRSLNANGYCWALIGEIAEKLNISNDVVYEKMLQDYSKAYTYMIVKPEAIDQIKSTLRDAHIYAYEIGNADVNGKDGIQLQLYYGSSTFDTKQFSRLLDGIISEAEELGIDTITEKEKQSLLDEWSKKNG